MTRTPSGVHGLEIPPNSPAYAQAMAGFSLPDALRLCPHSVCINLPLISTGCTEYPAASRRKGKLGMTDSGGIAIEPGRVYVAGQSNRYLWQPTRDYCRSIGLLVDEPWFPIADSEAAKHNLTQEQFDAAMRLHAWHVKHLFTPKNYRWPVRMLLAVYFLTGLGAKR